MHERDMANPLDTATKSRRHYCHGLNSEVFDLDSARNDGLTALTRALLKWGRGATGKLEF